MSSRGGSSSGLVALRRAWPLVFVALAAIFIPIVFGSFWLRTFTSATIFALASCGVGLLYGRLGLVSLASFAILGIGGWGALRVAFATDLPFVVTILIGGLAAAFLGVIIGLPALRLRGLYLALVTLMAAGAWFVVVNASGFPDGGGGFTGRASGTTARQLMPRPSYAETDVAYFRFSVVIVTLGFLLVVLHLRGRPGRAWAMIRRSEAAALSAGVNVTLYKTWAFGLAGFLAGVAGGLLAGSVGQLSTNEFPPSASMLLFALTVSAGAYSLFGAVLTGLLARALPALLTQWEVDADIATIIFGFLLMFSLTAAPEGLAGQLIGLGQAVRAKLTRRPKPPAPPDAASPEPGGEELRVGPSAAGTP